MPLILIHAIGGTAYGFYELGKYFEHDRPLFVFQDLGLTDDSYDFVNLEAMATFYIQQIKKTMRTNDFILGGLSFGANLAVEMASQLGSEYKYPIVMLDGWATYPDFVHRKKHLIPYLDEYFGKINKAMSDKDILMPDSFLLIHRKRAQYLLDYKIKPISHDIILFKSEITSFALKNNDSFDNHWSQYAKGHLAIFSTPGDHESLLIGKNAKILAKNIRKALKNYL